MRSILVAGLVALLVSMLFTPSVIRASARRGFGQEIREEMRNSQHAKRGTPTMGGVAILVSLWIGYLLAHLLATGDGPSASGLLVLGLTSVLGFLGFLDDFIRIRKRRNLGLGRAAKIIGQFLVVLLFAVLATRFPNRARLTPVSEHLSFIRDLTAVSFGAIGFVILAYVVIGCWSTAVKVTDGMDGLAAGTTALVLASYVLISFWQFRSSCPAAGRATPGCYVVRDPLDMAVVAAAAMGACLGFLWWNAAPARIFMGHTGSWSLGGLLAGLAMTTRTELLMIVVGGVFVTEALSVVLQVVVFRGTGRRLFRMAPFHHHFELAGWAETTVIIRFWILAAISCLFGLGLFYSDWLVLSGA
ncbi:MAG: phospho-N-acetylmuramoyl-pentapeptide-transferase [Sciscionella sp.]